MEQGGIILWLSLCSTQPLMLVPFAEKVAAETSNCW